MSSKFRIGVNTEKEILSNPPPRFQGVNLVFTPFAVCVGEVDYPMPAWTDFAGVLLFKWYRSVLTLASGKVRAARLPFWYTYEMWLRQTTEPWWRLSLTERDTEENAILHEAILIPEVVESALLTAIQNLLAGARGAGVWTEDCIALDALLNGRESYLANLEAGSVPSPTFLSRRPPSPSPRDGVAWDRPFASFLARNVDAGPTPASAAGRKTGSPPLPCPYCGAVVKALAEKQARQTCPLCGNRIWLG